MMMMSSPNGKLRTARGMNAEGPEGSSIPPEGLSREVSVVVAGKSVKALKVPNTPYSTAVSTTTE